MMPYKNISTLFHVAAKNYKGGVPELSKVMGVNYNVLLNKLNPNTATNKLTLEEACEIAELTQDKKCIEAMANLVNQTIVPIPEHDFVTDAEIFSTFINANSKLSVVGEKLHDAKDPESDWGEQISPREKREILPVAKDCLNASAQIVKKLEG